MYHQNLIATFQRGEEGETRCSKFIQGLKTLSNFRNIKVGKGRMNASLNPGSTVPVFPLWFLCHAPFPSFMPG